jgi:pyrimidine-nucleoside phosphorylase
MTAAWPGIVDFLTDKREGRAHAAKDVAAFVRGVVDGSVSRPQAGAWLAMAFVRGLDDAETVALTQSMTDSGERLAWPGIDGPFVDKHSTGGVGDKVSLVLAPLWAELGWKVPMISGRGLGHTGGTLDKLEAIPGFRTDLDHDALRRALLDVGCFMNGQTAALAPADRVLYALRNETQTVPAIPLIVASILSKKLAEGLDRLVLDVKCGAGAFMPTLPQARALAEALVRVGNGAGVHTRALITDMEQPLGAACGNGPEVAEALACLEGGGPPDLRACVLALAGHPDAERVLDSGRARERFERLVHAHGGSLKGFDAYLGTTSEELTSPRDGVIACCDALAVGRAVFGLGAGRARAEDPVHPGVGVDVLVKVGQRVERGQPLARMHSVRGGSTGVLDAARAELAGAFVLAEQAAPRALVLAEVG